MENPVTEGENLEWSSEQNNKGHGSGLLQSGLRLGKKIFFTGILISSAPVLLPPFVALSAIGFAFSVPFGFFFATYACTEKLMSKLLTLSDQEKLSHAGVEQDMEGVGGLEVKEDGGYGGGYSWDEEEEEHEIVGGPGAAAAAAHEMRDIDKGRQELVGDLREILDRDGYVEDDEDNMGPSEDVDMPMRGIKRQENGTSIKEGKIKLMEGSTTEQPSWEVRKEVITVVGGEEDLGSTCTTKGSSVKRGQGLNFHEEVESLQVDVTEVVNQQLQGAQSLNLVVEGQQNLGRTLATEQEFERPLEVKDVSYGRDYEIPLIEVEELQEEVLKSAPVERKEDNAEAGRPVEGKEALNQGRLAIKEEKKTKKGKRLAKHGVSEGKGTPNAAKGSHQLEGSLQKEIDVRTCSKGNTDENVAARQVPPTSEIIAGKRGSESTRLHGTAGTAGPRHAQTGKKSTIPSNQVLFSEEKIWEHLNAMRRIVGYRAPPHVICSKELKALYLFTGIEPPVSFEDKLDLAEVEDKLHYLMSIIGVK